MKKIAIFFFFLITLIISFESWAENMLPNIMLTGFWNPTGQMITQFSTDPELNPDGWQGENWEGLGFNIYSYFPEPHIYEGMFEVDYQATWQDFWAVTDTLHPIAIISFGAGDGPWEIEYNARNLTDWVPDYEWPLYPTPNPPDSTLPIDAIRNSTLPIENIELAVDEQTNVDAWVDWNGDPGAFLCEYIAYLSMWYRDLHVGDDFYPCISGGMIHVNASVPVEDATEAAEVTTRETIFYLLENLVNISGYVYVEGGVSPQGTQITFQGEESYSIVVDNPEGFYAIPNMPVGNYQVVAHLDNMYYQFTDVYMDTTSIQFDFDLELSQMVVEGYIMDSETSEPLSAYIYNEETGSDAYSDSTGFYHITFIQPGDYTLNATFWGYQEAITEQISVSEGSTTQLDISMTPLEDAGSIVGMVTSTVGFPILGAQVDFVNDEIDGMLSDDEGNYQFYPLTPDYDYLIDVSHEDYASQTRTVHLYSSEDKVVDFVLDYIEKFDGNDGGFASDDQPENQWEWGIPTEDGGVDMAHSGEKCWGTNLDGNYAPGSDYSLYSNVYRILDVEMKQVEFYHWYELHNHMDGAHVQFSIDNGDNWQLLHPMEGYPDESVIALENQPGYTGDSQSWQLASFDISDFVGEGDSIQFRFRFASMTGLKRGWFIDDFTVRGGLQVIAPPDSLFADVMDNDVSLAWEKPNIQSPAAGFNLYRKLIDEPTFGDPIISFESEIGSYIDEDVENGAYIYGISALFNDGQESEKTQATVEVISDIVDNNGTLIPTHFALSQNYPNPFNPTTTIQFDLPEATDVKLAIYSSSGQLVKTLINEEQEAGFHLIKWNAKDVASGVYFYKIETEQGFEKIRKCVLLK